MPKEQTVKAPEKPRADQLIQLYEQQLSARKNFESYWQSLHDYYYIEGQEVNRSYTPGNELTQDYLWDSTSLESADVFASGFMNYLTPPSSKWAKLRAKDTGLQDNKQVDIFLEDIMEEVTYALNRSNFYDQMFPSYKSSGVYGTSVLFEEEDLEDDIRFHNLPLKQCVIVEDSRGRCVQYFIEFEYTSNQAADRWGRDALSSEMQQEIREMKGDTSKHTFLLHIGYRHNREVNKTDKENLPIEAVWIDKKGRSILEESGYNEFPIFCHRFDKRPFVAWGYSPAMKALPFVRILNTIAKTNLRSMMKATDPPIAVPSNAFLAPFNMNPRAINTYKGDTMKDARAVMPFGNFGDPNAGLTAVEYYSRQVKSLMYTDTFLAFNQIDKQMNNPEIMERINEKMTLLGPAVGRYIDEVISPIIQRTIGILARRGKLPDPPAEFQMNPVYEIDFVGRLAQAQKSGEMQALMGSLAVIGQMAQFTPEVLDKIDPDAIVDETWDIQGAPAKVLRDDAEVQAIREGRAQASMQQQQMMEAQAGAQVAKDAGAAEKSFKEAND
jgi:hypothetical protein